MDAALVQIFSNCQQGMQVTSKLIQASDSQHIPSFEPPKAFQLWCFGKATSDVRVGEN